MHRFRITLISAAMVTTLAVLTLDTMAQPPGGRWGSGWLVAAPAASGGPGGFGGLAAPADPS